MPTLYTSTSREGLEKNEIEIEQEQSTCAGAQRTSICTGTNYWQPRPAISAGVSVVPVELTVA